MKRITNQKGSVLLFLLVAVVLMGLLAGIAGSTWKTITQRAKEEELLWRGNQIRKAIGSYYTTAKAGTLSTFPQTLEQLVHDPRMVGTVRHLRKVYPDPMTGKDWELIVDPTGRIQGVHSSSQLEPFKKDNFSAENKDFVGKSAYSEWRFVYTPQKTNRSRIPAKGTNSPVLKTPSGSSPRRILGRQNN